MGPNSCVPGIVQGQSSSRSTAMTIRPFPTVRIWTRPPSTYSTRGVQRTRWSGAEARGDGPAAMMRTVRFDTTPMPSGTRQNPTRPASPRRLDGTGLVTGPPSNP